MNLIKNILNKRKIYKSIREWRIILDYNYDDIVEKSNIVNEALLEYNKEILNWSGEPAVSYSVTKYKFDNKKAIDKLKKTLINVNDKMDFKDKENCLVSIERLNCKDFNHVINKDIKELKGFLHEDNIIDLEKEDKKLAIELYNYTIINKEKKNIYTGSKIINMINIPKVYDEDVIIKLNYNYYCFISGCFLIVRDNEIILINYFSCD